MSESKIWYYRKHKISYTENLDTEKSDTAESTRYHPMSLTQFTVRHILLQIANKGLYIDRSSGI